jgi:hypothetical protein
MEYCKHHKGERDITPVIDEWDREFITDASQDMLFELILAANFLEIKSLLCALLISMREDS